MFQFRRFPTYTYLIQCTLHGYCPCGLPHSEIRGLSDICSSPRLIAACHVLRRLLMPRHSPCALFSLTYRRSKVHSAPFPPASLRLPVENCAPFPCSSSPNETRCTGLSFGWGRGNGFGLLSYVSEKMVLSRIMQASQIVRNCNCHPASFRTLFHN